MPPNPAPTASTSTRKRKATRDDNGDLVELPIKKPKQQPPKMSETVNQKLAAVSKAGNSNIPTESSKKNPQPNPAKRRVAYVEVEEVVDPDIHPKSNPPRNPNRILEASSDDGDYNDNEPPPPLYVNLVDGDDDDDNATEIIEEPDEDEEEKLR